MDEFCERFMETFSEGAGPVKMIGRDGAVLKTQTGKSSWAKVGHAKNSLRHHVAAQIRQRYYSQPYIIIRGAGEVENIALPGDYVSGSEAVDKIYDHLLDNGFVRIVPVEEQT